MFDLLIHAAIHKAGEAISESGIGKKVGESVDYMLNKGFDVAGNVVKQTGKVIEKSVQATADGVAAAVKSYKNQK